MTWNREDQILNNIFNPNNNTLNVIVGNNNLSIPNHWYREDEILNFTFDKNNNAIRVNIVNGNENSNNTPYYRSDIYISEETNTITLSNINNPISELYVFVNGLLQIEGIDYTVNTSNGNITFSNPLNNDYVSAIYKT